MRTVHGESIVLGCTRGDAAPPYCIGIEPVPGQTIPTISLRWTLTWPDLLGERVVELVVPTGELGVISTAHGGNPRPAADHVGVLAQQACDLARALAPALDAEGGGETPGHRDPGIS